MTDIRETEIYKAIHRARDARPWELEPHYCQTINAMTSEDLHDKSDIAMVLCLLLVENQRLREAVAKFLSSRVVVEKKFYNTAGDIQLEGLALVTELRAALEDSNV